MTVDKRKGGMPMSTRMYRKVQLLAVGALAISALAASPALAGGRTTTTAPKCAAAPSPGKDGAPVHGSGLGFPAGEGGQRYNKGQVTDVNIHGAAYGGGDGCC